MTNDSIGQARQRMMERMGADPASKQRKVLNRIADALERIAESMEAQEGRSGGSNGAGVVADRLAARAEAKRQAAQAAVVPHFDIGEDDEASGDAKQD